LFLSFFWPRRRDFTLTRIPTDVEPLPDEFKAPLAIADNLLDSAIPTSATADSSERTVESDSTSELSEDTPRLVSLH
jgi:hypothetical protein